MNRNEAYWIFKDAGFTNYKKMVNGRPYNVMYPNPKWDWVCLETDTVKIVDFELVYLCTNEFVIKASSTHEFQLNIKYHNIKELKVYGDSEDYRNI